MNSSEIRIKYKLFYSREMAAILSRARWTDTGDVYMNPFDTIRSAFISMLCVNLNKSSINIHTDDPKIKYTNVSYMNILISVNDVPWWLHPIETFSALLAILWGIHRITRTKTSDAELWCFFYLRLDKRLSKQSWGWWFERLSRPLWRHCNALRGGIIYRYTGYKSMVIVR